MQGIVDGFIKNSLFKGLEETEIREIINIINFSLDNYEKGEIIAQEEDKCESLGLIIEGEILIERLYPSGKEIVMKRLKGGDVFGEALLFSKRRVYPATVISASKCKIAYLTKSEVMKLFSINPQFMENFMKLLSEKVIILNNKIKSLSLKTVRQKVADYILQECMSQKTQNINLKGSKEDLALYIGIPRPSLSRELIKFRDKGLIEFDRYNIKVIDIEELESILFD